MEIRIDINSDHVHVGKTTVAAIVGQALKKAFPDINIVIKDPEPAAVTYIALQLSDGVEEFNISATSIVIVDDSRRYNDAIKNGRGKDVVDVHL